MSAGAGRRAIRDELLSDLDGVTASIVEAVRTAIPAYGTLAPAQLEEVSAIAGWGTSRVLAAWVDGTGLDAADLQRFRGIGAARALDGRPLPVVLRAYRVAGSRVTDLVAELAPSRLTVEDALALARLWMSSIDALSEALYEGYEAANTRITEDRGRALGDLLEDLVTGRHTTPASIADRSRQLGVRLPAEPLLLAATGGPGHPVTETAWGAFVEAVAGRRSPTDGPALARVRRGVGVALLPRPSGDGWTLALAEHGWRGVALDSHRLTDVPRAFRLAELCLERAPERAYATRPVLGDADAAATAVSVGHRDADPLRLHRLVLGPLAEHAGLVESLDAYLACGNAADAAVAAHCHPQTLRHRLRRVRELTGRDVRDPWDRFVLELAVLGHRA